MTRSTPEQSSSQSQREAICSLRALSKSLDNLYVAFETQKNGGLTTLHTRVPRQDILGLKDTGSLEYPSLEIARPRKGLFVIDDQRSKFTVTHLSDRRYSLLHAFACLDLDTYPDGYSLGSYELETAGDMPTFDAIFLNDVVSTQEPLKHGRLSYSEFDSDAVDIAYRMTAVIDDISHPNIFKVVLAKLTD